jgi:hypothetical protein
MVAGILWGLAMGAILSALDAWRCGVICLPDAALTTAVAMVAGICTIGPLAAFGAHPR